MLAATGAGASSSATLNSAQAATNSAAIAGPMTKPLSPNSEMPPMVDSSTRKSGSLVSLPTRMGRSTLSTMPITPAPHTARPTPEGSEPVASAIDKAREAVKAGDKKIGTTGKGIGPTYEDKVARRGLRVYDLFHPERFADKLREVLEYHNFVLTQYFKADPVDFQAVYDQAMADAEVIRPMVADVSAALYDANKAGANMLFEGAQGTLLDIDHGTYPFVTSSNCVAGQAAAGAGIGPGMLHYVLGITKAYCTRVGGGPFPTELDIDTEGTPGHQMFSVGKEFGTVTGRKRRCGWFDAPLLRRSARINGLTSLCITKLDVLDGLKEIKICTGYRLGDKVVDLLPIGADDVARCEPIYETMPGWEGTTFRVKRWEDLPANAQAYLNRLEELCQVPIAIVSTGPERDETILRQHPFK